MTDARAPAAPAAPLADHLRDAIRLNRSRRAGYRQRGGLRADALSRLLVASERALLPVAALLDAQAARLPAPILAAELSDLARAPAADRPLPALVRSQNAPRPLGPLRRHARHALDRRDFATAARALDRVVWALRQRERVDGRRRALAVHVAESAGVMAARGAAYARQTDGATEALSVRLVRGHLALLPAALGARPARRARPRARRGAVRERPPGHPARPCLTRSATASAGRTPTC